MRITMTKIIIILSLSFIFLSSTSLNTIDAKSKKIDDQVEQYTLFEEEVTITNKTTKVDVGFAEVKFKKNFIPEDAYPITFTIKLYAEDGALYIEFDPDYEAFFKDVTIHIYKYDGFIYDVATDEYIYVEVPNMVFHVSHFSRWRFMR